MGAGDIDKNLKVIVEQSVVKQVVEIVELLKAAATKASDSRTSPGTSGNLGGGKYHFLPKGMTSCHMTLTLHIRLNGCKEGSRSVGCR